MMDRDNLAEASSVTTIEEAEAQHPGLDASAPAASEETPSGADTVVLAQTAEEVEAQYVNRAGGPEPTQEGDANADDEENAAASDMGTTAAEAAELTDDEADAPFRAPAPAADADAGDAADADAGDADAGLDIERDDNADGGDALER